MSFSLKNILSNSHVPMATISYLYIKIFLTYVNVMDMGLKHGPCISMESFMFYHFDLLVWYHINLAIKSLSMFYDFDFLIWYHINLVIKSLLKLQFWIVEIFSFNTEINWTLLNTLVKHDFKMLNFIIYNFVQYKHS